jgi:hypothetical protein
MYNPDLIAGIMQLIGTGDPLAVQFGYLLLGIWNDDSADGDVMLQLKKNMLLVKNF